jgi:hypothetical protein
MHTLTTIYKLKSLYYRCGDNLYSHLGEKECANCGSPLLTPPDLWPPVVRLAMGWDRSSYIADVDHLTDVDRWGLILAFEKGLLERAMVTIEGTFLVVYARRQWFDLGYYR